ncbi:hypothetical protein T06_13268, partial [Trichinella sp. T6]
TLIRKTASSLVVLKARAIAQINQPTVSNIAKPPCPEGAPFLWVCRMQSPVLRLGLIINICTATALAKFAYMLPKVNADNTNNKTDRFQTGREVDATFKESVSIMDSERSLLSFDIFKDERKTPTGQEMLLLHQNHIEKKTKSSSVAFQDRLACASQFYSLSKSSVIIEFLVYSFALTAIFQDVAYVQNGYGWRFNCSTQISVDAQFYQNRMSYVVTWTLDNAIWLKLDRGNAVIHRNLDEICQRRNGQTLTADILSNAHRYQFYYNEPDAQFWLEIINTTADDSGFWTCYVKISQRDGLAITETVTTVKLVVLDDKQMEQSDEAVNYETENSFMTDYLLDEYDKNSFTETSADNSKAANFHAHTAFQFFCVMLSFSTSFIMNKQ